jgi:hypothetical protein
MDDLKNRFLQIYDSNIASMFEQQTTDARKVSIQNLEILKETRLRPNVISYGDF